MKLSEEEQQKVIEWLEAKWQGEKLCQVCGTGNWSVSDLIFQLPEFDPKKITIGGPVMPVVSISCNNCGNTYFFNAMKLGVLHPPENPENQEEQDG